jgi:hypothetical protein
MTGTRKRVFLERPRSPRILHHQKGRAVTPPAAIVTEQIVDNTRK